MIARLIEWSARNVMLVLIGTLAEMPRLVWTLLRTREAEMPRSGGSRGGSRSA